MAVPFLALYLTENRHYSASRAGLTVSCYGLAGFVTSPYAGRLTDRIGPARLMVWALLVAGALMLVIPLLTAYPIMLAAIIVWAAFNEAVRPASFTLLTDAVPPTRKRSAITLYRVAVNLGMGVGPALGGFLAAVSYHWVFGVDAATAWLAALFLWWSMRSMPRHIVAHDAHPSGVSLKDRRLWLYLAGMLPVMVVFFQHTSTMPLFLVRELKLRPSAYGLLFLLNASMVLLLEIPISSYTSRWPYRLSLSLGTFLVSSGFAALSLCTGIGSAAVTVAIWTVGEMLLLPAAAAYLSDLAPSGRSGEYLGMQSALLSISMLLAPALGTFVLQQYGGVPLWIGMGLLGLISVAFLAVVAGPRGAPDTA